MAKADRNGKRKRRETFSKRQADLGRYFIYTDTKETEKQYFYGIRDSLPQELKGRLVIQVFQSKTDKLVDDCLQEMSKYPQYGEPWIVFDRDEVTNFDAIIQKAERSGIRVGWSNPCIEIWFDTYFGAMHSYSTSTECCRKFSETFKQKTGKEYDKADTKLYTLLKKYGDEAEAIKIAERRWLQHLDECRKKPSQMCPCTTVHQLVKEISQKVNGQL
mgnify:CR=1 FL=1